MHPRFFFSLETSCQFTGWGCFPLIKGLLLTQRIRSWVGDFAARPTGSRRPCQSDIVIPGDDIQQYPEICCSLVPDKKAHIKLVVAGKSGAALMYRLDFLFCEIHGLVGDELFPVQAQAVAVAFAARERAVQSGSSR